MRTDATRRRFLVTVGGALSVTGCLDSSDDGAVPDVASSSQTSGGTPETTRYGITFDEVVDAVDDLGMDRAGTEPIDSAFAAAYESGTLIDFPPGEYLIAEEHPGDDVARFGIRGTGTSRRDVQFVPTEGSAINWLKSNGGGPHLVYNVSFHERSDDSSQVSLWLSTSGESVLKNVEWLGRTPDDSGVGYSLTAEAREEDAVFTIDGIYAGLDEPATHVEYPDGVAFVRAGPPHRGELILRNPVIHERNSAATRVTAGRGVTTIQGGEFINNQLTSVRFSPGDHPSKVSSATGSYIKVDGSRQASDAILLDSGDEVYSGSVFDDIRIAWSADEGRGVIEAPEWASHGGATFRNCVVWNDSENTPTVKADDVGGGSESAIVIENCSFTGEGGDFTAENRPDSVIQDSCVDMPNASIDGFDTRRLSTSGCWHPEADS